MRAAIVGIAGPTLLEAEAPLLRDRAPAGVILFGRNVESPDQLCALAAALRAVLPPDAVLMVDQEGGRVARLRPPHWRAHPPAAAIGALYDANPGSGQRAAWLTGALIGLDCAAAGFDVVCAPVLDVRHPGGHDVIGDRSFGSDPQTVATLGRAVALGLMAAGIQPVAKHAPGHGRVEADSHLELPRVTAADVEDELGVDFAPFALNDDLPWFMTAHILYAAWDGKLPGTLSASVIGGIIRERIGFGGVLVSDDLAMRALSGRPADLALQALAAGCDLALYCAGDLPETADLLAACPPMTEAAIARLSAARAMVEGRRIKLYASDLAAERDRLLQL